MSGNGNRNNHADRVATYDTGGNDPERGVQVFLFDEGILTANVQIPLDKDQLVNLATALLVLAGKE